MKRITIFSLFWDLESKNVQDIHLQNHITMEDVKRRTSKDADGNTSDKRSVSFRYYVKLSGSLIEERFNLRFGRPQVDTCVTCDSQHKNKKKNPALNEVARCFAVAELIVHKRKNRNKCQSDDSIAGLCFDFMMCVQLPDIPVQDVFYYRTCRKGPNEVTSFIHDYLNTELNGRVTTLFLFSDNCGGQNKNHTIVRCCSALVENARFEEVHQYYPVRGHSFFPCDRAFGIIKRALKRINRIYTIYQLTEIIVHSSNKYGSKGGCIGLQKLVAFIL
ncbi:hypothetical protein C0J52_15201 [Blattella germanica]|nr:hypothetical protein C0J52_15201 [Blattella germanica]